MRCQCIICMDDIDPLTQIACLPCGHTFHRSCVYSWVRVNPTCPTCRCHVERREVRRVYLTSRNDSIIDSDTERLRSELSAFRAKISDLIRLVDEQDEAQDELNLLLHMSQLQLPETTHQHTAALQELKVLNISVRKMESVISRSFCAHDIITVQECPKTMFFNDLYSWAPWVLILCFFFVIISLSIKLLS